MKHLIGIAALTLSQIAAAGAAVSAEAASLEIATKIDAVTVYPDASIVTRIGEINLPQGESQMKFADLPAGLDRASLRLEGEGDAAISIGAVDLIVATAVSGVSPNALDAKLQQLQDERSQIQIKIDALQSKRAMIIGFSHAGPDKLIAGGAPLETSKWSAAWDAVATGLEQVGAELNPQLAQAKKLDDEILALTGQNRALEQRPPNWTALANISSADATKARFKLSYRVARAQWRASYDAALALTDGAKTVDLTQRAVVTQSSGEDWRDIDLTVSTARVGGASDVPVLEPFTINIWEPPPMGFSAGKAVAGAARELGGVGETDLKKFAPAAGAVAQDAIAAKPLQVALETNAYAASFKIPGRVSLASDGTQKSFVLRQVKSPANLQLKSAPGVDAAAYIEAHLQVDDAPLLPGDVSLIRDGQFVGRSQFGFTAPGDSVDLGFGADDKVKITRAPISRKENNPVWYNQTRTETREFKTSVKNLHNFAVKLDLIDQEPVSENTAIVIELLPSTTTPTLKQVGDKRGVMSWSLDLAPGESKDIRLAYRMKWPADQDIEFGGAVIHKK